MKEILVYLFVAISSLLLWTYVVHMFIGGLVSPETELWVMIAAVAVGVVVMGAMAWDVVRRRRKR